MMHDPSIFRDSGRERYQQKREQRVLPRLISSPIFLVSWMLLGLLLLAEYMVGRVQVPLFINSPGIELSEQAYQQIKKRGEHITEHILFFVPAAYAREIHVGAAVHIQTSDGPVDGTVGAIEPVILSPADAQRRYAMAALTQPVVVVGIKARSGEIAHETHPVQGQIQVGTRDMFSLLLEQR
ncbi:MAG: hypothetical protein J2P37_36070 [Ktedonobacteraceae bacterium]|nr:hypothetical protein [Ktedonobacteraceae bacterium]